jgi:Cys-tRNA(Pro)/Cys-tRNA(Cys) deacylase
MNALKNKTNAMRILDKRGITYRVHDYDASDGRIDGAAVAEKLGRAPETLYKTLVARGVGGEYYVFVIPVAWKLDLKRAAKSVGAKSVEMIPVADINKVTGYIRGGCSPIGMKKQYVTVIDAACLALETIVVSAGRIGSQVELSPGDLATLTNALTETISTL